MRITPEVLEICYPIVKIEVYKGGVKLVRKSELPEVDYHYAGRSTISELTPKSLARLGWLMANTDQKFVSILTLTYGVDWPSDGREAARQRNSFLTNMRRWYPGLEYVWVLEFQARDAPHYHVFLSAPAEIDAVDRQQVAEGWARLICPTNDTYVSPTNGKLLRKRDAVVSTHAHPKAWEKIREKRGAEKYVMAYALKPEQKKKPVRYRNIGRFWGASTGVKDAVRVRHYLDVTGHMEARKYLAQIGREDLAQWDVLPRLCFKKNGSK